MGEPIGMASGACDPYADTVRIPVPEEFRRELAAVMAEDSGCNPYDSSGKNAIVPAPRRTLDDMRRLSYLIKLSRRGS
jgi:hypothetical protein